MQKRNLRKRCMAAILSAAMVFSSVNAPILSVAAEDVITEVLAEEPTKSVGEIVPEAEKTTMSVAVEEEPTELENNSASTFTEEEITEDDLTEAMYSSEAPLQDAEEVATEDVTADADGEELLIDMSAENVVEPEEETGLLEEAETAFKQSQTVDGVKVTVLADEGVFPNDATLSVSEVDAAIEEKVTDNVEAVRDEDVNVAKSYTFDVKILDVDGNEIQPDNLKGQVKVSFATEEVSSENLDVEVYHISDEILNDENKNAEKLDSNVETVEGTEAVVAKTAGFSYYTVEFTYNNLQYVMDGDSKIALADILAEVGLTGTVEDAVSSNPVLFSVAEEDGKWMISANQAFSSEEWLNVTIDGVEYEIKVTDAQDFIFGELKTADDNSTYYTLSSGTYNLTADTEIRGYLYIKSGVTVTINLNGYTLKRTDTSSAKEHGHLIWMVGTGNLTINGNGGILSGGNSLGGVGAIAMANEKNPVTGTVKIYNTTIENCHDVSGKNGGGAINISSGTLEMTSCTITGCTSNLAGNAINIFGKGKVTLKNCTITNNKLTSGGSYGGGAIAVDESAQLILSGKTIIESNTYNGITDDIMYCKGTIDASGLTEGSRIGIFKSSSVYKVTSPEGGVVVQNLGSNPDTIMSYFFSDVAGYGKKKENTNQMALRLHTHTWSYAAKDNVITATCAENNPKGVLCSAGKTQTLTLDASKCGKPYDGSAITAATITASTGWTTANSLPAKPSIYYKGVGDTTYNSSTARPTNAGTYQASITVGGKTATAEFKIEEATASFKAHATLTKTYGDAAFDINITDKVGAGAISYASSDTNVAAIENGKIVIKNAGTTNITVSAAKSNNYTKAADKTVALTVLSKALTDSMISLSLSEPEYDNGNSMTQGVTVSDKVSGAERITANDYTVSGDALSQSAVGTYTVKVTAKNNYTGEITKTWKIKGKNFTSNDIVAEGYNAEYDGQSHGISVKATDENKFKDFKVLYSDSKNGEYSETAITKKDAADTPYTVWYKVSATGYNESAPASEEITISPKPVTVNGIQVKAKTYDGTASATLDVKGATFTDTIGEDTIHVTATGVTASFADKNAGIGKSVTITGNLTLDNPNYVLSAQPTGLTGDITQKDIHVDVIVTNRVYDGSKIVTVAGTLRDGDICTNDDLSISGTTGEMADKKAGTDKSVTTSFVLGGADKDNYNLMQPEDVKATIAPKEVTVRWSRTELTYNGKEQKPEAELEGVLDADETVLGVSVEGGKKEAGTSPYTATASLVGEEKNNYTISDATVRTDFMIAPKDIAKAEVTLGERLNYNGKEQIQKIVSVVLDGQDVTFDVTGDRATEAGEHTMKLTGKGNYKGEVTKKYVIFNAAKVSDDGHVKVAVRVDASVPKTKMITPKAELMDIVTDANDLSAVAQGANLEIWMEIKDASQTISAESKAQIQKAVAEYTIGSYLNISLFKKLSTEEQATQITGTAKAVKITVEIPTALQMADPGVERTYVIVRNHEGKAEWLNTAYDRQRQILTFETDKFSDYAIMYKDRILVEEDQTGSFGRLKAKVTKRTNNSLKLEWTKLSDADGYMIYGTICNHGGKQYEYELLKTVSAKKSSQVMKKLKQGTYYKFYVAAYKTVQGKKIPYAKSVTVHATTTGGKYGVAKAVKISKLGKIKNTDKITLKVGRTARIKASEVKSSKTIKHHREIMFESSNEKVATVSATGRIKAIGKGKCSIWVYAQNGVYKTVNVTVK
ncbi:MAG: YDG domain-containing protein [Eubacteriales bacterium]|nr:YDG domain-containing protein [Eubacteriales bacterium]